MLNFLEMCIQLSKTCTVIHLKSNKTLLYLLNIFQQTLLQSCLLPTTLINYPLWLGRKHEKHICLRYTY